MKDTDRLIIVRTVIDYSHGQENRPSQAAVPVEWEIACRSGGQLVVRVSGLSLPLDRRRWLARDVVDDA